MMRSGVLAAALFGSALPTMGEETESQLFEVARTQLDLAIMDDPELGERILSLEQAGDWEGVVLALESSYPAVVQASEVDDETFPTISARPELVGTEWNDTWYEEPRDVIRGLTNTFGTGMGLADWYMSQQWRSFTSPVGKPGSRKTADVKIMYVTVRGGNGTKGAVVFSFGMHEDIRKYDEIAYEFIAMGYSPLYLYAHRGQGESDRLIDDKGYGYVESHRDYNHDLRAFTELVAEEMAGNDEDKDKPLYLVCHSLGCGVSTSYLIEEYEARRQSRYFAVAMVTPSLQMNTGGFPLSVASAIGNIMCGLGQGKGYAPGNNQNFDEIHNVNLFAANRETQSFTRYKRDKDKCLKFESMLVGEDQHPGLCNHGISNRWVKEAFDQYSFLGEFRGIEGKKLEVPMLMMTGGGVTDGFVMNPYTESFCQEDATNCALINYPSGGHWLLGSVDELRNQVFLDLDNFFTSHTDIPATSASLPPGIKADGEGCNRDRDCMSRFCDANFGWDIFGGKCASLPTFLAGSHGQRTPVLAALTTTAAVAASLAAR